MLLSGLLLQGLSACAPAPILTTPATFPEDQKAFSGGYTIGAEDTIEVLVWKNPDLSKTVTVRPDGRIALPLLGDISVAGLTPPEVTAAVKEKLKAYYKEPPEVSVSVPQVNSYAIYMLGDGISQGKRVIRTGTTFLQAIAIAGGFTPFASTNNIILRRKNSEGDEVSMRIRYKDVVAGTQPNFILRPNDIIIVP